MSAFSAVSEPSRRQILDALLTGPQPVNALVKTVGMSQPVVSKHRRILRDAGLVAVRPDGQRRVYSLIPKPLSELDEWLTPYRELWANRLDALAAHLDNTENNEGH